MTSATLRAAPTTNTTGTGPATSLTATLPAGTAAGDLLLIWCAAGGSLAGWSAPGFTAVPLASAPGGANQLLWRAADGTEPGTVTVTASSSHLFTLICAGYKGGNAGAPFDPPAAVGQENATSTTITVAGVTTTLPGDVLAWFGCVSAGAGGTPAAITPPAGFTAQCTQVDTSAATGSNVGALMADFTAGAAGATGDQDGSLPSSHANGGQLVSIAAVFPPGRQLIVPNGWPARRAAYY